MLRGQTVSPEVKRNLLINEVIQNQLKTNYDGQKTSEGKKKFIHCISGKVVKKYRLTNFISTITSKRTAYKRSPLAENQRRTSSVRIMKLVQAFYEEDQVSRMCPGKNDTVTYRKIKKQKRYLNDSLKNI